MWSSASRFGLYFTRRDSNSVHLSSFLRCLDIQVRPSAGSQSRIAWTIVPEGEFGEVLMLDEVSMELRAISVVGWPEDCPPSFIADSRPNPMPFPGTKLTPTPPNPKHTPPSPAPSSLPRPSQSQPSPSSNQTTSLKPSYSSLHPSHQRKAA